MVPLCDLTKRWRELCFFSDYEASTNATELWEKSDGPKLGTTLVKVIQDGANGSILAISPRGGFVLLGL